MRTRSQRVAVIVLVMALALLTRRCSQVRLFTDQGTLAGLIRPAAR